MEKRRIGDILVLGLSALAAIAIFGYAAPLAISPIDGLSTSNASVLFEFSKADTIMIDDNANFSSPMEIMAEDNLVVNLAPGTYYWKIKGARESKVHTLTIISEVDLQLRERGENYVIVNAGNTELDVEIYNGSRLTGNVVLERDEEKEASGTLFVGRESDGN